MWPIKRQWSRLTTRWRCLSKTSTGLIKNKIWLTFIWTRFCRSQTSHRWWPLSDQLLKRRNSWKSYRKSKTSFSRGFSQQLKMTYSLSQSLSHRLKKRILWMYPLKKLKVRGMRSDPESQALDQISTKKTLTSIHRSTERSCRNSKKWKSKRCWQSRRRKM